MYQATSVSIYIPYSIIISISMRLRSIYTTLSSSYSWLAQKYLLISVPPTTTLQGADIQLPAIGRAAISFRRKAESPLPLSVCVYLFVSIASPVPFVFQRLRDIPFSIFSIISGASGVRCSNSFSIVYM